MKRSFRLLLSVYIGFVLYSLLILFWGNSGFFSLQKLNNYHSRLIENNINLSKLNKELKSQMETLKHDSETIKVYARALGYFDQNERVMKVDGFRSKKNFYAVGKIVKFSEEDKNLQPIFRTSAIIVGIVAYFVLNSIKGKKDGNTKRRSRL